MTRVSENSNHNALRFAINKTKSKLENLQLKGAHLKNITRPSDNPVGNVEALSLTSVNSDNKQYLKNSNHALLYLNVTEQALEQLTDIMVKAKDLAIQQSSDLYNGDVRKNVTNEVKQLRNQAIAISNKRIGNKHIFSGYKTLERPFNNDGTYSGDNGHITVEISKDFFIPVNLHGEEVFFAEKKLTNGVNHPLNKFPEMKESPNNDDQLNENERVYKRNTRQLASVDENVNAPNMQTRNNLFSQLSQFADALQNNDPDGVQDLLESFDATTQRLITLRTRIGSVVSTIESSRANIEKETINVEEKKSMLVDADVAEIFSDISKQQEILKTTYKASQGLINNKLLDFMR